ncbi:MAG TPA: hypothetical protein VHQ91_09030 [Geminicoccaceae bacterium]|nr:hypothetical protein [Geminicoccaceae bacterium]
MQIAVAVAHESIASPPLEQGALALKLRASAPVQLLDLPRLEEPAGEPAEVFGIAFDDLAHAGVTAPVWTRLGPFVEPGDFRRERIDRRSRELAAFRHPVEQRRLVKTTHLEQPFDGAAAALERVAALGRSMHADQSPVEHGRGPPVELQLGLERNASLGRARKIEKAVADRALHFEDAVADQEDQGCVRRDPLDLGAWHAEGGAPAQRVDQRALVRRPRSQRSNPFGRQLSGRS